MDANLVRPPRIDFDVEQREFSIGRFDPALNLIVRDCIASCRTAGRHSVAADAIAPYRRVDRGRFFFWPSVNNGSVIFFHFPASEL